MRPRAQTSVEMMVVLIAALLILGILVDFANTQLNQLRQQKAVQEAEAALHQIVSAANETYAQGPGASKSIQIRWPEGVDAANSYFSGNVLVVRVFDTDVLGIARPPLSGSIPTNEGDQFLRVRAYDGFVVVGQGSLSVNPSSVFSTMNRDDNDSTTLTLTNGSSSSATLEFTADWNYADVNVALSSSSGSISGGENYALDVNFASSGNAIGAYTGSLTISGTYSSKIESLIVPLTAEVFAGNSGSLVVYPSTFAFSTQGADTNSITYQLCNTSSTPIKNITLLPSSGDAGDFVQGISTVDSLSGLSCANVEITVIVPEGTVLSLFSGSVFIQDFSGAHTLNVPLSVNVKGMNGVFNWDWTTSVPFTNAISNFTISNTGSKAVTLTHVRIRKWWECDWYHSYLTTLNLNGTLMYSGSLPDGNTMDIPDFNIPVLTSYTENVITFDENVYDQNEQFVADVNFSDGTVYTSSVYGTGCAADTTPPSTISDLNAYQGPEPGSVRLSFTLPGDDGNVGTVTSATFAFDYTSISSGTAFRNASKFDVNDNFGPSGTVGSLILYDMNVGRPYYFAVKFLDENFNESGISNSPFAKPWNHYSWSGNDFNNGTFPDTLGGIVPSGSWDVNSFFLHNLRYQVGAPEYQMVFRIKEDTAATSWIGVYDFDANTLTRARLWYPGGAGVIGIPSSDPDFDANFSLNTDNGLDLLDNNFGESYHFDGQPVNVDRPLHFYVDILKGFLDFNIMTNAAVNVQAGGGAGGGIG